MIYTVCRPILSYVTAEIKADNKDELVNKIEKLTDDDYDFPGSDAMDIDYEWNSIEIIDDNGNTVVEQGEWKCF